MNDNGSGYLLYENMSGIFIRGVVTSTIATEPPNKVSSTGKESTSLVPDQTMKATDTALSLKKNNQSPTSSSSCSTCQISLGSVDILQKHIDVANERDENDGIAFERESQIEQLHLSDHSSIGPSRRTDELDMSEDEIRTHGRNNLQRNDVSFVVEKCDFVTRPRKSNVPKKELEVGHEDGERWRQDEQHKHYQSDKELSVEDGLNDFNSGGTTFEQIDTEGAYNDSSAPTSKFRNQGKKEISSSPPTLTSDLAVKDNLNNLVERMARSEEKHSEQTPRQSRSSSPESKEIELPQRKLDAESNTEGMNENRGHDARVGRLERRNSLRNIEAEVESKIYSQQSRKKSTGSTHSQDSGSIRTFGSRAPSITGLQSRRCSFTNRRSSFTSHSVDAIELSLEKLEYGLLKNSDESSTSRAKLEATRLNRITANNSSHGRTRSLDQPTTHSPPRVSSLPVPDSWSATSTKESIGVPPGSLAPGAYRARFYGSDDEEVEIAMDFAEESEREEEQNQILEESLNYSHNHSQNHSQTGSSLQSLASQESLSQPVETAPVTLTEVSLGFESDDQPLLTRICSPKSMLKERKCFLVILLTCCLVFGISLAVPLAQLLIDEPQEDRSNYTDAASNHVCPEHNSMKLIEDQCEKSGHVSHISKCVDDQYVLLQEMLSVNIGPPTGVCKPDRLALLSMIIFKQNPSISNFVLSTLYFSTDGPSSWKSKDRWISSKNVCTWEGIGCKIRNQNSSTSQPPLYTDQIEKIELANNRLNGYIPANLDSLKTLELLDLSRNTLTGEIPMEIGNIENLTVLDLSQNSDIGGTIPATVASLQHLKVFIASGMKLSGEIPSQIAEMRSLKRLVLSSNQLSHLPSEIGNLKNLSHLQIHDNMLFGQVPIELGNCTNLYSLTMQNNYFSGEIPSELGLLTHLTALSISYNKFDKNPLPIEILRQPSNLTQLSLIGISLSGSIPTDIALLKELRELELTGNDLTGSIPTELGFCESLELLNLNNNRIGGEIPSELGNLSRLESLYLLNNQLTGVLPSEMGMMTSLENFLFESNHLSGMIASEICSLWDHELLEFGSVRNEEGKACEIYYGGTQCPDINCCRKCTKL